MLNKVVKLRKINYLKKTSLFVFVLAVLFFNFSVVGYAYVPFVSTGSVTSVTDTTATFNGSVNADNFPTSTWFEYGTDGSLNNAASVNAYIFNSGYSGNLIASVGGLTPNTTYYFRAVAQNSQGRVYGNIYSFITNNFYNINTVVRNDANFLSLNAITESASSIASNSVKLNALLYNEANNSGTTWFEYGINTNLGSTTTPVSTGNFPSVRHVSTLSGLSPSTTYYYRAVVVNSVTEKRGNILSFTTSPGAKSATTSKITSTSEVTKASAEETESYLDSLSANVFSSGSFLPTSILGWLILIILILILVILGKRVYGDGEKKTSEKI